MIEISCDLGEASNQHERDVERALWPLIDVANVACGGHAGDDHSMREAIESAKRLGVALGAHPSYPDRVNFGRKSMTMAPEALRNALITQIHTLRSLAADAGVSLVRVKPHGALYNDAHRDLALAGVVADAVAAIGRDIAIVAGDTSMMARVARSRGITVVREVFADRRYRNDGSLVPRIENDALLTVEEAVAQAHLLATERSVVAQSGQRLPITFDTMCIHADSPQSVERLQAIRHRLAPYLG